MKRLLDGRRLVAAAAMVARSPIRGSIDYRVADSDSISTRDVRGCQFWATIAGAIGALGIGRLVDRFGSR